MYLILEEASVQAKNTILTELLNQAMQNTILKRYFLITVCKTTFEEKVFNEFPFYKYHSFFVLMQSQLLSTYAEDINLGCWN